MHTSLSLLLSGLLAVTPPTNAKIQLTPKKLTVDNQIMIALPEQQMDRVLMVLEAEGQRQGIIDTQTDLISAQKLMVRTATETIGLQQRVIATQSNLILSIDQIRAAAADRDSGGVWTTIGISAGAAVLVGAVMYFVFAPKSASQVAIIPVK